MLLAAIDESHRGTYDFIYLPIDFKVRGSALSLEDLLLVLVSRYFFNFTCFFVTGMFVGLITINNIHFQNKCNVGYAFINMINPDNIVPFYKVRFYNILLKKLDESRRNYVAFY